MGFNGLFALFLLAYPVVVYFALDKLALGSVAIGMALLFGARFLLLKRQPSQWLQNPHFRALSLYGALFGMVLVLLSWILNAQQGLLFYPLGMNLLFLALFMHSLFAPPPIIERIARLQQPELSPQGVAYTRKVTVAWCLFFLANGAISLFTVLSDNLAWWTLYNGLISYVLMGLFFMIEFGIRRYVQRKED